MTRAMDLDTVAPDDLIETNPDFTKSSVEMKPADVKDSGEVKPADVEDSDETKREKVKTKSDITENLSDKIYNIVGHTKHPLASLLVNPHVFDFEERADEEKIVLVARSHWFTNVSWVLTTMLLILALNLVKFVPIINDIPAKFQMVGVLMWCLVTFAFSFEKFLSWYFDVLIITNERVIDIDFNNLLDKKFSEAKISMIQDTTSRVSGVGQTLFNYGTVYIQTAGEIPQITFEMVPNPEKIIKVLQLLREEESNNVG